MGAIITIKTCLLCVIIQDLVFSRGKLEPTGCEGRTARRVRGARGSAGVPPGAWRCLLPMESHRPPPRAAAALSCGEGNVESAKPAEENGGPDHGRKRKNPQGKEELE